MSMRDIHLGIRLPFESDADRESSEHVLMGLLGFNCMVNHRYLLRHPETPLLYDSGVKYAVPDQVSPNRLSGPALKRVADLLRKEGAEPHAVSTVLRFLNGVEEFLDIPALYKKMAGDCNELTPVRVAELWRSGIAASPFLTTQSPNGRGGITYHAVVMWPDGSIEDPSLILGMGGASQARARNEEIAANITRWSNYVAAAKHLVENEGADPRLIKREIEMMGLVPKSGVFKC